MGKALEFNEIVELLRKLISTPSFSNQEDDVANIWQQWLEGHRVKNVRRFHNNVYALSENFDREKPILLLNSHMDTVKPVESYTRDPFEPTVADGRLYGLGSNDAGGAGVSLAYSFLKFKDKKDLPFNLLFAITASEEKMGELGMRAFLPHLRQQDIYPQMAIVGEPTGCQAAIAERGLVVCDAEVKGIAGHAARNEGINAIYRAIEDIETLRHIKFPKESKTLGPINVAVTMFNAGTQHNVVPDRCHYVIDIRTTDAFTNEDTVRFLQSSMEWSTLVPRSTRIQASALPDNHPFLKAAKGIGLTSFISPTTSDMALMHDIQSIKIGPGESKRSHSADEYINLEEIHQGIKTYENFLISLSETLNFNL